MEVRKATAAVGAYVEGPSLEAVMDDEGLSRQLRALLLEHEVLFLRDQPLSAGQFQALARRLGTALPHPAYPVAPGADDVQILESTPEVPSKIEQWHSDMSFSATPPSFTLLHGQVIPEYGGDTLWASATAAYEALSAPFRKLLDGLSAEHDFSHGFRESLAEPGGAQRLAPSIAANPPVQHPVIRTHPETGRKAIYVNPLFTTRILEMTAAESQQVLAFLFEHLATDEFTVRLNWAPRTLVMWDNRSTLHRPINDYFPQHRKHHRVTLIGERPQ